mgnify:CR=1 FL=1
MKLELIGHDEKYAVEQSLLTLFPDERPVYGPVTDADESAARITLTEDADSVCVTTELRCGGKAAADCYSYPLSGTDYEKEGQRRHALGLSFFRAAKEVLGADFTGDGGDFSPCFLMTRLFDACGWAGPGYMQLSRAMRDISPLLHTNGLFLHDGVLTSVLSDTDRSFYRSWLAVQYYREHVAAYS